ncbi:MAG: SnoaL-like domain protein [uncultured archaeon A07HN63]|jgi:hypothetical protein|nr:MAG: SnoaL-like domain protein [uncultured archaeon A07HN63]
MKQDAEATIRAYYDALRAGEPLSPFFLESLATVKVSLSERFSGYPDIADELSEQSAMTTEWTVESADLSVTTRDDYGWFDDEVTMAWTNTRVDTDHEFDTRWTGTLEANESDGTWQFVTMHVSTAAEELQNDDALFDFDP